MELSLNTATVRRQWDLAQIIDGCVRHGIRGVSPWRDQISALGLEETKKRIDGEGLIVTGLCRGGFFAEKSWKDDNLRAIDEARVLGAPALILVVGGMPEGSKDLASARKHIRDCIAEVLPQARQAGVPLAIEPLHPMQVARAAVNTLEQALHMCEELGEGVGVAVDVYHVWWDPKLADQLARARGRILGYHICDWLPDTRDLFNDRGMMGDGVIDLPRIRGLVEGAGYEGMQEVEIFSDRDWWKRDPDEVLRTCKERLAVC
ncbi:MAG: sugar phosphate isomerase/epimerase family protein [Betaproteobacteria bacterium]